MKILILMGGERVEGRNETYPLYMAEIERKMFLEYQLEKCKNINPTNIVCCVKSEDIKDFHVNEIISQSVENSICVPVQNKTYGAVCTALLATEYIDNDEELLILAVDEIVDTSFNEIISDFRNRKLDCGLVSFSSVHPRYSFAKLNNQNQVVEVAEKRPISKNALASFFYFKQGKDFVDCAKNVIRKDNAINDAFYISQIIDEMVLLNKKIEIYTISSSEFHPIKTEMQLFEFLQDYRRKL